MNIYRANLIFSKDKDTLETLGKGYIGVKEGKIEFVSKQLNQDYPNTQVQDFGDQILIPGFCDMHTHAPQFENIGLGMDQELLEWLDQFTLPTEAKYKDAVYAKKMYVDCVTKVMKAGTTRVCFYATVHVKASQILVDIMREKGLRGYVGKVNMDDNCPDFLIEDSNQSIIETEQFLKDNKDNKDVKPIISPRFAPSCKDQTLHGLGELAKKYDVPIQSHINENMDEIKWVETLFPQYKNYADVYDQNNLLNKKTLMAHCIHMKEEEIALFKKRGTWAVHCPQSNTNISSGLMPLTKLMDRGVKVAFGTDVSGGNDISMVRTMVSAMQISRLRYYYDNNERKLTFNEAFYIATKGGGEFFGKVGSFEKGYEFDALLIDDQSIKIKQDADLQQRLKRFVFGGDERCIKARYIAGKQV